MTRMAGSERPSGYIEHVPHSPMPESNVGVRAMFGWVNAEAKFQTALKPWTLVSLEEERLVAVKRNLWWRLRTWWLNFGRRRERAIVQARLAAAVADYERRRLTGEPLNDGSAQ